MGSAFFVRSRKVAEQKFPEVFEFSSRILPRSLLQFSPNFVITLRALFHGKRRPLEIHQKSPPFFKAKSSGNLEEKSDRQKFSGERAKLLFASVQKERSGKALKRPD